MSEVAQLVKDAGSYTSPKDVRVGDILYLPGIKSYNYGGATVEVEQVKSDRFFTKELRNSHSPGTRWRIFKKDVFAVVYWQIEKDEDGKLKWHTKLNWMNSVMYGHSESSQRYRKLS